MTLIKSISGIRGTIGGRPGEGLTPVDVIEFSSAFAQWIIFKGGNSKIIIGRDARPSGKAISQLVANTLVMCGFDVIDLGISTTPTVEMAVPVENAGGGIIVTASHNPVEWNALKLLNDKGEFISAEDGQALLQLVDEANFDFSSVEQLGAYSKSDYLDFHIKKILELPLVDAEAIAARKFKIAVDAVNSSGGIAIPALLKALGVDVVKEMYCKPNGDFPHNPEPLPEHLGEISDTLKNGIYDLGIVVDPDVDRLALVSENGEFFGEEYTLVAVADYVLQSEKGNTVSNLSSSQALGYVTRQHGSEYFSAAVGEVNVVTKMKEVDAVIGGEGNGGIIYPKLHYGRDALVGVALLLTSLAKSGLTLSELRSTFPEYVISKNKIELTPEIDVDHILKEIKAKYSSYPVITIDGVKIMFPNKEYPELSEWVHLRKSNTEPIIRIYAESSSRSKADQLANRIIADIKELVVQKA